MEHSPITLETLRAITLATRGLPALPFARVPLAELWTAKRVLDAGTLGVIFPFVDTPSRARTVAAACRYPPRGRRGSGAGLANFRWPTPDYYDFADQDILCVAIIEHIDSLRSIDEIAATPGVDVLFVGVSDLSFSLGFRGEQDRPELKRAIERIAAAARRHKKYLGRPALDPAAIEHYRKDGFQFFQGPTDVDLLRRGARDLLSPVERFLPPNRARNLIY